jgi:hypothetical protein
MQMPSPSSSRAVHGPSPRSGIRPVVHGGLKGAVELELQIPFMGLLEEWFKPIRRKAL